ncbi:MAG: Gfo/Idh/MocA family oxidoreductase [candidate division Zixibacteria bacterium]|nr:Gfo/Idh/MocA family oxidoreductase [candidate division Zixibacteria bacterium]
MSTSAVISAPRYRAVIIGSGSIGSAHAAGYAGAARIDLVACADTVHEQAQQLADRFGVKTVYTDYRRMLDTERPDIVSICTWHPLHAAMTIAAAARQPRVILCEKPMATSIGEAEDMETACRRNGVRLAIGFQRRFLPAWVKTRDILRSGAIGTPVRLSHTRETGLLNATSHGFDCMRFILDDPKVEWVFAQVERKTDRYERNIRCEDRVAGFLKFEDGVQANFQTDLVVGDWTWAFVQGTEGMIHFDDGWVKYFNAETAGWKEIPVDPVDPWVLQAEELVDWIEERTEHRGRSENGMWTMHMMMGAYESARCRELVRLPMHTRVNPLDLMVESGDLPVRYPGRYDVRSFLLKGESMRLDTSERVVP